MPAPLSVLTIAALLLAGVVHAFITPEHFAHAPAHGLFFGAVGMAQIAWAIASLMRRPWGPNLRLPLVGLLLSGGMIVVWLLTHLVATPFASEGHPIDAAAAITKLAEAVAFVGLCIGMIRRTRRWSRALPALLAPAAGGAALWIAGLAAAPLLPSLGEVVGHDHGAHVHGVPEVGGASDALASTAAYFSIVNSGLPDRLVAVTGGEDAGTITLHQTTINDQQVARMQSLDGVALEPHRRVDFSPAGSHVMLDALPRRLVEGDRLDLTLHFASGRKASVTFDVRLLTPEGRVNFAVADDFQISNAWVRATATLDGLVVLGDGGYEWRLPEGFPLPRVPANNPMTEEKAELGRYLFYDVRLSGNGTMSCASCHLQALAFTDGLAQAVGSTGEVHPRSSMSLVNVAYNATLTWANPLLLELERQIVLPMFGEHPVEMGITGNEDTVLDRFRQEADYQTMFAAAFPNEDDPFTFHNITQALATFLRTLISGDSPYDRYVRGDQNAISDSAKRGMTLFFSEALECHHCHTGFNFSLSTVTANSTFEERPFFNTGLYNVGGTGAYPTGNTGLYEITQNATDMGRFRPQTLRNIALTAPYMHDGSIATLEAVVQFYMDGGRNVESGEYAGDGRASPFKSGLVPGFVLTEGEQADVVAFLESLTDEAFITDPRFSDPFTG